MTRRTLKCWKSCKCGRAFSKKEWEALPAGGEIVTETEKLVFRLELRHCLCKSTIAIERRERKPQLVTSPLLR